MKIAMVTADFPPNVGGVATHVAELGAALAAGGHDVRVYTSVPGDGRRRSRGRGVRIERLALPGTRALFSRALARALTRALRAEPVEVLHVHGLRSLPATRRLRDLGMARRVLFTNHTSGFLQRIARGAPSARRVGRRLTHLDGVLAPSEELVEATRAAGYPGPVRYIPNGVDTDRFHPGSPADRLAARDTLGLPADACVVLLARRLVPKNGPRLFAESAAFLVRPDVWLLVAGDGSERGAVETILASHGMRERTRFLGSVDNDRMPEIYRAADISVLPSLEEATSIAGLESMASGLPLVGTEVGGIPHLVRHRETGLLVPPADPRALGRALAELVAAPEKRQVLGAAARRRAVEAFSWARIARETLEAYRGP